MIDGFMNFNKENLINFGKQPVSNRFLYNINDNAPSFDLGLDICINTGLVCINKPFPISEVKPRYGWITCFEPEEHLDNLTQTIINLPGITKSSVFGAYSFKDDSTIDRVRNNGFNKTWRIDPKDDLNLDNIFLSVESYQDSLNSEKVNNIIKKNGQADVFIIRHVLEHSYDIVSFVNFIKLFIKDNGYIVWEIPDCERAISAGDCTIVWEEHTFYFTEFTFKIFLHECGFSIEYYKCVQYPLENSIIAIVKNNTNYEYTLEGDLVQHEINRARQFVDKINYRRDVIRKKLVDISSKYGDIAIFGGGHLSVAFISILNLSDLFNYVVDDNENKKGMYMPIGKIPIIDSKSMIQKGISVCLLALNPQNHNLVISNNDNFVKNGGIFLSIFPGTNNYIEDY
ncbi:SAM-dependent methyltransferase [bacterium]|jgi:hypothetical protein|nr:SAM-dependent methyltransferase [bacterium]